MYWFVYSNCGFYFTIALCNLPLYWAKFEGSKEGSKVWSGSKERSASSVLWLDALLSFCLKFVSIQQKILVPWPKVLQLTPTTSFFLFPSNLSFLWALCFNSDHFLGPLLSSIQACSIYCFPHTTPYLAPFTILILSLLSPQVSISSCTTLARSKILQYLWFKKGSQGHLAQATEMIHLLCCILYLWVSMRWLQNYC